MTLHVLIALNPLGANSTLTSYWLFPRWVRRQELEVTVEGWRAAGLESNEEFSGSRQVSLKDHLL